MTSDGAHHGLEFKCVPVPLSTSGIGAYLYPRVDTSQVEYMAAGNITLASIFWTSCKTHISNMFINQMVMVTSRSTGSLKPVQRMTAWVCIN